MTTLGERQAALVAALVAGASIPADFDPDLVRAASAALLRKRAAEVAGVWPLLAAGHGHGWTAVFSTWATGRAPVGALRDGWDFARDHTPTLPELARTELAEREARYRYDGRSAPRPRGRLGTWLGTRRR